jgi:FSR family fosmidomycin resistance protein-like MFS transporter
MPENRQIQTFSRAGKTRWQKLSGAASLTLIFLLIEFFDELHYGIFGAALPSIKAGLGLNYNQLGMLLGLPGLVNTVIEPVLMISGDTGFRRFLIAIGGLALALSLVVFASASTFSMLLLGSVLAFPASGAFVSLSQASLIDRHPSAEARMMARWTVFGSIGNLLGPLLVAGGLAIALSWRWMFASLSFLAAGLTVVYWTRTNKSRDVQKTGPQSKPHIDLIPLASQLWQALHQRELTRWTMLLLASDLLLDTFTGYLALYLTDAAGFTAKQASLAFGLCMLASLAADLGLIPLLERYNGRRIVRASAWLAIGLYPMWLFVSPGWAKILLLVAVRLSTIGWYPVLKSEAFRSLTGQSGTVMAIDSLSGLAGGGISWMVGAVAGAAGVGTAMWLLLAGPICLLIGMPASQEAAPGDEVENERHDG